MADLGMDWNELTEEELRDELSIRGLDTTGTKEYLVRKIQADETEDTEPVEAATEAEVEQEDEQTEAGDAVEEGEEMQPEEQAGEADAGECAMELEDETEPEVVQILEDEGEEEGEAGEGEAGEGEAIEEEIEEEEEHDGSEHGSDQVEDIVGEIDDMNEFIEPGDEDEEKGEENGHDDHKDEDGKKIFRPETQLPDRRQLRTDLLLDYRYKSVCMFPVVPADLANPIVQEQCAKCFDFGAKFYGLTDSDGKAFVQGYIKFHFVHFSDAVESVEKLKSVRDGMHVEPQKPHETHEQFVSEVDKGKVMPLKNRQTQGALLVSGLPKETTEDELRAVFTDAVGIFIARDETRKPKGYAYLDYALLEKEKKLALKDLGEVKLGESQLTLTDYHKWLSEGIPMEEYAQGDPVTGLLSNTQLDIMVRRLSDLRRERHVSKKSAKYNEMLDRRMVNLRTRLSRDNKLRQNFRRPDKYHIDRRPLSTTTEGRSRDRHYSPSRRRSPSYDLKRRRGSYPDQHGSYGRSDPQRQTMDLIANLTEVLNTQMNQQGSGESHAPSMTETSPRESYRTKSYSRGGSGGGGSSYSGGSTSRGSGGYSYYRGGSGGSSGGGSSYRGSSGGTSSYRGSSSYSPRGSSSYRGSSGGGGSSYRGSGGGGSSYRGSSGGDGGGSSYSTSGGTGSYSRGSGGYSYTRGGGSSYSSRAADSSSYAQEEAAYPQQSSYSSSSRGYSSGGASGGYEGEYARDDRYNESRWASKRY